MPNPESRASNPGLYACVFRLPAPDAVPLASIAQDFSPRFEIDRDDLVSIDVSGLTRLLGTPHAIGEELRRAAAERGLRVHVAVAGTRTAAMVLALARPGVTVIARGDEAAALAPIAIGVLEKGVDSHLRRPVLDTPERDSAKASGVADSCLRRSVLDTPERDSAKASGVADSCLRRPVLDTPERDGARASGVGVGPHATKESKTPRQIKSDASIEFALSVFRSWGLRTLGDLAALPPADLASRLGRPALVWQAIARGEDVRPLIPALEEERFESRLELEWPIDGLEPLSFVLTRLLEPLSTRLERRDRGAAVLHVLLWLVTHEMYARRLELPTPMRDVRTLRTLALLDLEAHPPAAAIERVTIVVDPTPGRVLQHTLFTRAQPTPEQLSTLMARLGAVMGQDRIGAPALVDSYRPGAFAMRAFAVEHPRALANPSATPDLVVSALRRCRRPIPARVVVDGERPVRVTTDRRGFDGGAVVRAAGPWRVSGDWWESAREGHGLGAFNRDDWEVALADGAVYAVFRDRETGGWFIDGVVD